MNCVLNSTAKCALVKYSEGDICIMHRPWQPNLFFRNPTVNQTKSPEVQTTICIRMNYETDLTSHLMLEKSW